MKNYINILFLAVLSVAQIGCQKDKMLSYDFGSGIVINKKAITTGLDSMTLSFAVIDENIQSDTIELPIRIVGHTASVDREVSFGIIEEQTTADPLNYELLPAIIAANSYEGILRIKVNKTQALLTKEAKVWITLTNSTHFNVGPIEQSTYLIKINDYLTKPSSWNDIRFGEYSQAKYSLIIRETGYIDFSGMRPDVLIFIVGKCRNVLTQYIQIHGKEMLDENELPVRFP